MRLTMILAVLAVALFALGACGSGGDEHDHGAHDGDGGTEKQGDHDADGDDGDSGPTAMVELKKISPSADYPLTTCVVTGEELGSMGEPLAFEYEGQEVQFCCAGCVDDFKKSPAGFMAKVKAARDR